MNEIYRYPYFERNVRLIASSFWLLGLKKRVGTDTVAGVYGYLEKSKPSADWARQERVSKFLYNKDARMPIRSTLKMRRYELVFPNACRTLDHSLFALLDKQWIHDEQSISGFLEYEVERLSKVERRLLNALDCYLNKKELCIRLETNCINTITRRCSLDSITALVFLYFICVKHHAAWQSMARIEKAIFFQFISLFYFQINETHCWTAYQMLKEKFLGLAESQKRKSRLNHQVYEPIFFGGFAQEAHLKHHIKLHFT